MIGGYLSSIVLAVSGLAGVVIPHQIGPVLHTDLSPPRAKAEFRLMYGALTAFGIGALIVGSAAIFVVVGAFWLAAAAVRLLALAMDRPEADWTYWAFLALELTMGAAGILAARDL